MKLKKIIYIPQNKLTNRDYFRLGYDIFINNDYHVESWDLTSLLRPFYHQNFKTDLDENKIIPKNIFCKSDFYNEIDKLDSNEVLIITLLRLDKLTNFIYKKLNQNNISYIQLKLTDHPENYSSKLKYFDLLTRIKSNPKELIKKFFQRLFFIKQEINNPYLVLTSGLRSFNSTSNNKLKTHALDYDEYLKLKTNNYLKIPNYDYAVFIDNNLPHTLDHNWGAEAKKGFCASEIYYSILNNYFKEFQSKTGLKIIISKHPRSNIDEIKNNYSGCEIISDHTAELIKYSKMKNKNGELIYKWNWYVHAW